MGQYPNELKYTKEHEWIKVAGNEATIGITEYAAEQLGDVVHVDLPKMDEEFEIGNVFGSIESVKSVSDIYIPVSGKVIAVNEHLVDNAALVNEDTYGEGWIAKIQVSDKAELNDLLTAAQYEAFLSEEA